VEMNPDAYLSLADTVDKQGDKRQAEKYYLTFAPLC